VWIMNLKKKILAFEIEVESVVGKFKLSQNRSLEDREKVVQNLSQSTSSTPNSCELAKWMREISL